MRNMHINIKLRNNILFWVFNFIIFFVFCFLFYAQSSKINGLYVSDLHTHIKYSLDNKNLYSLVFVIFKILLFFFNNTIVIAIFLSTVVLLTIYFTYRLFNFLLEGYNDIFLYIGAIICNFVMAIYIP